VGVAGQCSDESVSDDDAHDANGADDGSSCFATTRGRQVSVASDIVAKTMSR
jgi:hypothetical protein